MTDATGGAAATALGSANSAGAAATGAAATTSGTESTWYSGLSPEYQGVLEKKGWNSPDGLPSVMKSYLDMEKAFRSGDKVLLPKDDADVEGHNALFNRLGRPENPDGYKFPEGVDANTVKALAPELHKLGITQKQAEGLAKLDMDRFTSGAESERLRAAADQEAGLKKIEGEWGTKFQENMEVNRRAMRNLGISVPEADKAMAAIGTEKFLKLLNLAGVSAREDNTAGLGESQLGFGMTANRAKAELSEKGKDLHARARTGDKEAKATLDRLYKVASNEA